MSHTTHKVVILGEGRVGKTSLVSRFVKGEFSPTEESTVQANMYNKKKVDIEGVKVDLSIWDTAGQERFHALGPIYYRNAAGAVLVYDITDADTFERVKNWIKELRQQVGDSIQIVICGNKGDMEKDRAVPVEKADSYAAGQNAKHFTTSAKMNMNVQEAFEAIAASILRSVAGGGGGGGGASVPKSRGKGRVKVDLGGGGGPAGPTAVATSEGNISGGSSKKKKKLAVVEDNEYSAYGSTGGSAGGGLGGDSSMDTYGYSGGGDAYSRGGGDGDDYRSGGKATGDENRNDDFYSGDETTTTSNSTSSTTKTQAHKQQQQQEQKERQESPSPASSPSKEKDQPKPIKLEDMKKREGGKDGKEKKKCPC